MRDSFIVLGFFLAFFAVSFAALAQDERLPENRQQISFSFAPLVRMVSPSVVNIYTKRTVTQSVSPFMGDPFFEQFFGNSPAFGGIPRQRVESALGSGAIVDSDGLVVTNAHVIKDAEEITVGLPDGREFAAEKIVVDAPSDLAVLRIDPKGEKLPAVMLEPSESLEVGDLVLAIGNPFGVGQTVTSGIVSAQARSSLDINDFNFFIQTDAAINPGNSGGPLVAMDGRVVGINTAIYSRDGGSLGIGFAIPSEMVATVVAAARSGVKSDERIVRPWLGITVQPVTSDIADSLDFKHPYGVLVAALHEASPAKKAGVSVGDIILSINGKEIREPAEMKFRMATIPVGGSADFEVLRKDGQKTLRVAAVAPPEIPPRQETVLTGANPLNGITVSNINPAVAIETGVGNEEGVVVTKVAERALAGRIMAAGDVIVSINGHEIKTVAALEKELKKPAGGWVFIFSRNGQERQVILR